MGAPVAFFEITSHDPTRLTAFYRDLFGWTIDDSSGPEYSLVDTGAGDGAVSGGIGAVSEPGGTGGVSVYMRVDDLQASLDRAEALGGKELVPPTDLPDGYGRFAMFADPDGNSIGLWA
ncbi:VOC family protein [Gordonia sp. NPDC127522]|uniref:VOC family protein n=1 Tax=Gordonia sp. NPDC127522 TaxID=3345390 RepID=UPI003629F609